MDNFEKNKYFFRLDYYVLNCMARSFKQALYWLYHAYHGVTLFSASLVLAHSGTLSQFSTPLLL